jgi:hypothetical protein
VVLEDADLHVVTKVVATSGRECRIVEQLLGLRPWAAATASRQRLRGSGHLWQTLCLVPLVHDGVVRVDGRPDLSAVVMRRLQPLKGLWRVTKDVRMLLRVVSQLLEVRCSPGVGCRVLQCAVTCQCGVCEACVTTPCRG